MIAFVPEPQITRATVNKNQIRFEIQVPDPASTSAFVDKLASEFKHEFRANESGYYGDDPCPVTVAPDAQDKSKVVATYSLEGWTPKIGWISEARATAHAFKSAGVRMGHYDIDRGEMDERIERAISDAFKALDGLNRGEPQSAVAVEVSRRQFQREVDRSR